MAVTEIIPEVLKQNTFDVDALATTAPTAAADGFVVDYTGTDSKIMLVFNNTNAAATARTATIKMGNGLQGVSDIDSGDIAAGKFACVAIESGRFKNVTGTNKGKVLIIPSHAELKMAAIVLP